MTKKFLTLMVIPHNESHVREFHLSRPFLWGLYLILGGSKGQMNLASPKY